jgi:hypothetical protein
MLHGSVPSTLTTMTALTDLYAHPGRITAFASCVSAVCGEGELVSTTSPAHFRPRCTTSLHKAPTGGPSARVTVQPSLDRSHTPVLAGRSSTLRSTASPACTASSTPPRPISGSAESAARGRSAWGVWRSHSSAQLARSGARTALRVRPTVPHAWSATTAQTLRSARLSAPPVHG